MFSGSLDKDLYSFLNKKIVINTINAYSYVLAKNDVAFQNALLNCDILLPDGFSIVWAARFLKRKKIKKIAGEDIFLHIMGLAERRSQKVFFLGSTRETLQIISNRLANEYPNVKVDFYSPPYKDEFSIDDNRDIVYAINSFKPDALFIGMTAPKQEKWVERNRELLDTSIICSIGAVFDFYAGTVKRPSPIWIKMKLEWLIRLLKEPRRLWKRYLVYSPIFFVDVFKEKYFRKDK